MKKLLAPALCLVLLSGCSGKLSDPDTLRDLTAKVVAAANDKDPSALRAAVATMRSEVDSQQQSGSLEPNQATVILRALAAIERNAGLLTATPTPTPSPTPAATTPAPTQTVTVQPTLGVGLHGSPSPAATP